MAHETRTRFYLSPELSLLYPAPIPAATLFLSRFILTICLSARGFFDVVIFVLAPLIALGIAVAASWHYYLFILPVVYLLRVVSFSLGSILSMLLIGKVPSKWLMRITVGLGFLSIGLWVGLFAFFGPMDVFPWVQHWIEEAAPFLFPLVDAVAVLRYLLLMELVAAAGSFARLFLFSSVILVGCILIAARIYHAGYDKSQTFDVHTGKQSGRLSKGFQFRRKESSVIFVEWKKATRNYAMAQGSVFFLVALLIYLFMAGGITLREPWDNLLFLGHIGVIGFLVPLAVDLLFYSAEDASEDAKVAMAKKYGLLKAAPFDGGAFMRCYWLAPFTLQLFIAAVIFLLMNLLIDGNVFNTLLSVIVFAILVGSAGALATAMEIVGGLVHRMLPFIYYVVALGILALGQIYTEFDFLGFLHYLPQGMVPIIAGAIFFCISAFTFYYSFRLGVRYWEEMEI